MKKLALCLLFVGLMGLCSVGLRAEDPAGEAVQSALPWPGAELNLRIFEGLRYAGTTPTKVVTSSFLSFLNYTSIQLESDESVERQVRQVFNLKDAKLLSEANLQLRKDPAEKAFHIFRLDSREYLILVTRGRRPEPRQFHIEVYEQGAEEKTSLLDMEFSIPAKNAAVFGFDDTEGKPYFLAFSVLHYGIKGGGGPAGAGGESAPPKLVKSVDPVYPEIARQSKVQGVVILEATTDIYGRVAMVKVLRSIPLLDQAAIDAVRQWEYEPAIIDGQPKQVTFTVTVRFDLEEGKGAAGVTGGVVSGVLGGVEGGVQGGVQGAVAGGVEGGVQGGVTGQGAEGDLNGAIRCKDGIQPPKLVKMVEPVYPEIARQAQVEGVVILEATTDEDGNVAAVRILRSIPLLDQPAIEAVRQWKYEPLIIDGKRRKAIFTVTARFALTSGDKEKDLEKFSRGAVKAVGAIKPPKLLKIVEPVYPGDAKKALIEGVVILSVKTDATGHVKDVMILRSVSLLNQAAIDAVKQWVYEPYVQDGKPTPVVFTVTVRFQSDRDAIIKPRDLLQITVQELPDLNQEVRVSDDGLATLTLLGRLDVEGQTRADVEKNIAALLTAKYLKVAHVNVTIKDRASTANIAKVIGAVQKPGPYEIPADSDTLLQMISLAGGLTDKAESQVVIHREVNGVALGLFIDLKNVTKGSKKNTRILPNDVIEVK
jgi:TonB family protein